MSSPCATRSEVRDFDRRAIQELGVPGIVLMENAGKGAAQLLLALGVRGPVLVCCGKGNNGGDGLVIARHLHLHGQEVRVLLFCDPAELEGDALAHYTIARRLGFPLTATATPIDSLRRELPRSEWVVDALLGTGLTGAPRSPYDQVIGEVNRQSKLVLAVDIPSGLDADGGHPLGATIRADHTATFAALKRGFLNPAARTWTGLVHLIDIGVPWNL